ncbi:MAG: hypothetical protein ABL931_15825 [Usitatibacteraceae bacterium]
MQTQKNIGEDDVVYWLDANDQICFVNEAYDRLATAYAAGEVASSAVLKQSIWDYITDTTTRQIYRILLTRVRAGHPTSFRIRCDSPDHRRSLQIDVSQPESEIVEFRVRTLNAVERPHEALLDFHALRSGELLRICSWCNKVNLNDAWREIDDVLVRVHLFELGVLPGLTHGICGQCSASMMKVLAES